MRLRLSGEPTDDRRAGLEDAIRGARLDAARGNPNWSEVAEPVRRERFLVDAESDRLFTLSRADVFETASANALTPEAPLAYYVDREGGLVFLEAVRSPATYSEYVRRRVERGAGVAT